ncbi:MAG: hypothetical protein ABSF43_10470 [Rectinemataceae bacterium]
MIRNLATLDEKLGRNETPTNCKSEPNVRERPNSAAIVARTRAGASDKQFQGTEVIQIGNVLRAPELRILHEIPQVRTACFKTAKKWECVVLQVNENDFTARLIDDSGDTEDSISTFSMDEVTRDDRRLVEPGAIFYWSIGYKENPSGVRTRESILIFRRVPAWSKQAIDRIKKESEQMFEYFNDDTSTR